MDNLDDFGKNIDDFGKNTNSKKYPFNYESANIVKAVDPQTSKVKEEVKVNEFNQWQLLSNNTYTASFPTVNSIPSGMYELFNDDNGKILFKQKSINSDEFIFFPDSQLDRIIQEIDKFWTLKDAFKKYKFTYKRGILLYGKAGVGKSVLLYQAIFNLINEGNGIVINVKCHPNQLINAIETFKKIEPSKNVIVIIEDIDAYIYNYGEESVLSFLDGESSCENTLTIATTNYPEKLDKRIVSRPRRFDRVIKINLPTDEMRKIYFEKKLNLVNGEINKYVQATKNFTFAAMTELVISTKCFGNDFDESVEICKNLLDNKVSREDYENNKLGFNSNTGAIQC